jgi:hypothetical protein
LELLDISRFSSGFTCLSDAQVSWQANHQKLEFNDQKCGFKHESWALISKYLVLTVNVDLGIKNLD